MSYLLQVSLAGDRDFQARLGRSLRRLRRRGLYTGPKE